MTNNYEKYKQPDGYFYIIYKTTNILNNKFYIGMHRTKNIYDSYIGSGTDLKKDIKIYGKKFFVREFLYFLSNIKELSERESELVDANIIGSDLCYNKIKGGILKDIPNISIHHFMLKTNSKYKNKFSLIMKESFNKICVINKDGVNKYIKKEEIDIYINDGWTKGIYNSDITKKKKSDNNRKRIGVKNPVYKSIWINKDNIHKMVKYSVLHEYINDGWVKGRLVKDETRLKCSLRTTGSKNPAYGRACMHKNEKNMRVKRELVEEYINDGWIMGFRKVKNNA